MDAEQVNQVSRLVTPPTRPSGSGGNSGPSAQAVEVPSPQEDTVSLSTEGRRALEGERSGNGGTQSTTRELDVTEHNQVILKIKDQSTDKVIKQIPPEAQVRLRQAIQEGVESLDQNI